MSDYPEVIYWLTLINTVGLKLNLVKPIIQRWCVTEERRLSSLLDLSPLDLSTTFGLSDEQAAQVLGVGDKLEAQAAAVRQWQAEGIEPLIRTDPGYPKRLIYTLSPAKHPLVLWTHGPVSLLNQPGVTMLGRNEPNDATAAFINELLAVLEVEEIGLVSMNVVWIGRRMN